MSKAEQSRKKRIELTDRWRGEWITVERSIVEQRWEELNRGFGRIEQSWVELTRAEKRKKELYRELSL